MPKQERPLPKNLVVHYKYGSTPRPSGLHIPEEEIRNGFWRYHREHMFPESVLVANTSKQNYTAYPRKYYVDVLHHCRNCARPFIFCALEQRHWFETLHFYVDADCVLCPTCRRDSQALRRRLRRYSDLVGKDEATSRELEFLVDDAAYLFARGVLKDTNSLGRLKNRAQKAIPDYAGTQLLVQELTNAKGA